MARDELGQMPSYTTADFSASVEKNGLTLELFLDNAFDERGVTSRYAECDIEKCGQIAVYNVPVQPATVGLKFSQRF
jgi:outer membrane receptor protein involved in Fe transport